MMGMFDSVYADCPSCGETVEFQSKESECYMSSYTVEDAPLFVLIDVLNDPHYCRNCGAWLALVDPAYPPEKPPRPSPKAVRLREPAANEISIHSTQPQHRWWEAPFIFKDICEPEITP